MDRADTSSRERELYRVTLIGSVVNVLLTIGKFAAGIWGHSAAMVADAVHSLSDLVTDVIVIVFVRLACFRPPALFKNVERDIIQS